MFKWINSCARALGKSTLLATRPKKRRRQLVGVESLEGRAYLAADPIYQDAAQVETRHFYDQTSAQYASTFNTLRGNFLPVDVDVADGGGGQARINSIWIANPSRRPWAALRDMTSAQFNTQWTDYSARGYRLVDQETYLLGTRTLYAGIWIKNTEQLAWVSRRNMTATSYQAFLNQNKGLYIPTDVDIDNINGALTYSLVMVRNLTNRAWVLRTGLTDAAFSTLFQSLSATHRVSDIESYQQAGVQRYGAVWVANTNGRAWASVRDMTEVGLWNRLNEMADLGYRPVDMERYQTSSGTRYAAVWRQDGSRVNWSLKSEVDALAVARTTADQKWGFSVTVSQNGNFLYRRGFGQADDSQGLKHSSQTINRLASISKAVGATLTLDLQEQGLLDIDNQTRSYVPNMPVQQSHTLAQLMSHRGGAGHYDDWTNPTGNFATQQTAAAQLWDQALVFAPGTSYLYSTHGYTLLGAALEGAVGGNITQIVRERLSSAYNLPTMQVENRSDGNRYRSRLYQTVKGSVQSVTADNTSWKVLGGGLESSSLDLARFGQQVINGTILSPESRATAWTAPDANNLSYGMGWDLGQTRTATTIRRFVAHSGSQRGAATYILMYPETGVVITVMSNQTISDTATFWPRTLAFDIASKMLT
ncbi:MAG: serine hydrolase [Pirellulaceae bacterium]|nr:serine hydrolase [Pirellulaceae bacterium]